MRVCRRGDSFGLETFNFLSERDGNSLSRDSKGKKSCFSVEKVQQRSLAHNKHTLRSGYRIPLFWLANRNTKDCFIWALIKFCN